MSAHAHVRVHKSSASERRWLWWCLRRTCPAGGAVDCYGYRPTHAEALKAALDHCARYPIKDVKP